jgi:hypothetical protein
MPQKPCVARNKRCNKQGQSEIAIIEKTKTPILFGGIVVFTKSCKNRIFLSNYRILSDV